MFKTIRAKFTLVYSSYVLAFIILIIGGIYLRERPRVLKTTIESYQRRSKSNAGIIGNEIRASYSLLLNVSKRIVADNYNEELINDELKRLYETNEEMFQNTVYIDNKGKMIDVFGVTHDISEYESFQMLKKNNKTEVIFPPFSIKSKNKSVIVLGKIIRDLDNKIDGIIGVSFGVAELADKIRNSEYFDNACIWIIDQDGNTVFHSSEECVISKSIFDLEELGYRNFTDSAKDILGSNQGFISYFDENLNKTKVLTYSEIPNTLGWKLLMVRNEKEIYEDVNMLLLKILISGIIMLTFLIALIMKLTESITHPIKELTKAVESSIVRNFEPLTLDLDDDNEIAHLVLAYNEMTTAITVYTEELEELVAERTLELDELNKKLSEKNMELSAENENLFDRAARDALTGLFNRTQLNKHLENVCDRMLSGSPTECSILFLDLDNFKFYNDTFGHDIGDKILKIVTADLKTNMREHDFIARYGGDEFIIVLPGVSCLNASTIKNNLVTEIDKFGGFEKHILKWLNLEKVNIPKEKKLGVSVGSFNFNESSIKSVDKLIRYADKMMYAEKKKRKKELESHE